MSALRSLKYGLVLVIGTLFSMSAWSDCACFCVNGELTTMCTDVHEAQNRPDLCPSDSSASCLPEAGEGTAASYEPPNSDATNCRDVRVYDAIRGEYVTAKACDVI